MAYDDSSSSLYQTTGSISLVGPIGPAGPQGPVGASGNTIWNGSGAPPSSLGLSGDFYLDTTNFLLYGPKTYTGWPASGVSTRGAQGNTGTQGPVGPTGPAGPADFALPAVAWAASTTYSATAPASLVYYQNALYVCLTTHVSQSTFSSAYWQLVVGAPSYDSVTLTTSAKAPTVAAGDNTTNIATSAFVTTAVAAEKTRAQGVESGKAASGANSDITSLSGLTTALSLAQGGTGVKTLATLLQTLGFQGSFGSTSGYVLIPTYNSGTLIYQWGMNTCNASGALAVGFGVSFPNQLLAYGANPIGFSGSTMGGASVTAPTKSQMQVNVTYSSGGNTAASGGNQFSWWAIGY